MPRGCCRWPTRRSGLPPPPRTRSPRSALRGRRRAGSSTSTPSNRSIGCSTTRACGSGICSRLGSATPSASARRSWWRWTEPTSSFDRLRMRADDPATLARRLITGHGRATPLLGLSVGKDELKNQRNDFEDLRLSRLKACLPDGVDVTILTDRDFKRRQIVRVSEESRLRLRPSISRQYPGRRGLDRQRRPGAQPARCGNHCRPLQGPGGRLRPRQGYQGALERSPINPYHIHRL